MKVKRKYDFILVILLLLSVLSLGGLQLYLLANLVVLISCTLFFLYNKSLIISLFVILLPTNGLFSTENNIFGILSPVTISQLFVFIVLIGVYQNKRNSKFAKLAFLFLLSLFLFNTIYDFRNALYHIYELDFDTAFRRLLKNIFRFGSMYLLVSALDRDKFVNIVIDSIHVGIIFLTLSAVFTTQLSDLKFLTTDASEVYSSFEILERKSGFFAFGDVNSLGGLLATYIGFIIFWFLKNRNYLLFTVLLIFSFLGLLYTGSRTAIISVGLILILLIFVKLPHLVSSYKIKLLFGFGFAFILLMIIFPDQVDLVLDRFSSARNELDTSREGTRVYKWLYYLNYIGDHTESLYWGTHQELYLKLGKGFYQARVPHNLYITILFHSGVILLAIIFYTWFKMIKLSFKYGSLLLIAIPTFATSFYISDWGYFQYFILFIPIIGILSENKS